MQLALLFSLQAVEFILLEQLMYISPDVLAFNSKTCLILSSFELTEV
jgi:hypothetical protein